MSDKKVARRRRPQNSRESNFDVKVFFFILVAGVLLFVSVVGIIRWWQNADLLDPWLRHHPKFNGKLWAQKQTGKAKPWLGAEAGILNADMLYKRAMHNRHSGLQKPANLLLNQAAPRLEISLYAMKPRGRRWPVSNAKKVNRNIVAKSQGLAKEWPKKQWPVMLQDLVVAIPNHKLTESQLMAGRSARLGLRTFVATNYSEQASSNSYPKSQHEVWDWYPDARPARSFYTGDDRAALTPFLAYKALGESFKWMLYGDDDTVFFSDAVLKLAATMNPDLPFFVTDNLWWSPSFGGAWHPNPLAPRCLPCGYDRNVTLHVGMRMKAACPCTPAEICSLEGGYDDAFADKACGAPRSPARTYSMHGGAGALISIGLLRNIEFTSMERCINHQWSSGGDAFLTQCLWEHGFAHTTPDPLWHPRKQQMFDPSPSGLNPDDFIIWKASHVLGNMLQQAAGVCADDCQLEMDHTVSLHLRARRTGGSEEGAAAFIRAFSRLSSRLTGRLEAFRQDEGQDVTSSKQERLAKEIDDDIESGIELVRLLAHRKKGRKDDTSKLDLEEELGIVHAKETAKSGIADAVAGHILEGILQRVKAADVIDTETQNSKAAGLPGKEVQDLAEEVTKTAKERLPFHDH